MGFQFVVRTHGCTYTNREQQVSLIELADLQNLAKKKLWICINKKNVQNYIDIV